MLSATRPPSPSVARSSSRPRGTVLPPLNDGTVLVTSHDDEGRVTHAIRYDKSMEHLLEELEGEAAEAAYGRRGGDEIDSPDEPAA